jgi:hypothetical protein
MVALSLSMLDLIDSGNILQNNQDAILILELNLLVFYHKSFKPFMFLYILVLQRDFVKLCKSQEITRFY